MSIKPSGRCIPGSGLFEIDVILDEYQTQSSPNKPSNKFEIDVILDEYQTLAAYN